MHIRFALSLIAAFFLLAACAGSVHKAAENSAYEPKKLSKEDRGIKTYMETAFAAKGDDFSGVQVDINKGRILLSGEVLEPETRLEAVQLSWKAPGVKEVISEVEVDDMAKFNNFAEDIVIKAQARAKLLQERKAGPANYTVDSINGVVYLMGIADSKQELARVDYIISRIQGVKKVINRTTLKS